MEEAGKLENFINFATSLGISDSPFTNPNYNHQSPSCLGQSLSISYFPNSGGRGLCAVRDLKKGELILRVPKSALLTSQTLILNDHNLSLSVSKSSLSFTQILTVALLNEVAKGKRSCWYPYLTQFPSSYDILAGFDQFEIQALQVDDAIWAAEKALEKTKIEWKSASSVMEQLMFKPHYMSFKAWIWASASISSRTMHITWDAAGCFCPVGDFFNYAAPEDEQVLDENLTDEVPQDGKSIRLTDGVFEEEYDAYCFYARKNYRKGDQVLLSYGTYTNLELLEHYGFILNENPNDKAYIPLPSDLHSLCSYPGDSLYIHQNGKPSFALLSAMRLWATPTHLHKSVRHLAYSGLIISTESEIIVMKWLATKCRLILKNLSSIEEDKLLLSVIDKEFESAMEVKNVLLGLTSEGCDFLKVNGLLNDDIDGNVALFRRVIRSMDRWKLAIWWRVKYKTMLRDCISHCTKVAIELS